MLELGNFDDSIFGEAKQRNTNAAVQPYNVKTCNPRWFDECDTSDPDEVHNVYKYRGDDAYYNGQYEAALAAYNQCQEVLHPKNVTMWRDIQEARTRCLQCLGDKLGAVKAGRELQEISLNYEQKTSALYLMADVHRHFNSFEDESEMLYRLLQLHSTNAELWVRLATVYSNLRILEESTLSSDPVESTEQVTAYHDASIETELMPSGKSVSERCTDDGKDVYATKLDNLREFTCLLRAGQLMRTFENNIGSFARARVAALHQKVKEKVKNLNIPEKKHKSCLKFLVKMKQEEDDIYLDDSSKIEMQENITNESFEAKWFSWDNENRTTEK